MRPLFFAITLLILCCSLESCGQQTDKTHTTVEWDTTLLVVGEDAITATLELVKPDEKLDHAHFLLKLQNNTEYSFYCRNHLGSSFTCIYEYDDGKVDSSSTYHIMHIMDRSLRIPGHQEKEVWLPLYSNEYISDLITWGIIPYHNQKRLEKIKRVRIVIKKSRAFFLDKNPIKSTRPKEINLYSNWFEISETDKEEFKQEIARREQAYQAEREAWRKRQQQNTPE